MRRLVKIAGMALLVAVSAIVVRLGLGPPSLPVPAQGVELSGLTVVNPGLPPLPGRTVRVEGGSIVSISTTVSSAASPAWAGAYALPGLVDLHVHHPPRIAWGERELFALLFLRHGVTTVRDVGSFGGGLEGQRREVREGKLAGPRIFACGRIVDGSPPGWPGAQVIDGAEQGRAVVARWAEEGSDCIKVYNRVGFEAYRALYQEARARGLPVIAHLPHQVPLEALGEVELQHLMGLISHPEGLPVSPLFEYAERSRRHGLSHTPTLVAFARGAQLVDLASLQHDPAAGLLPSYYRDLLWNPDANPMVSWLEPAGFGELPERYALMQDAVGVLRAHGVPVLAGTDTMNPFVVPGISLHEELLHLAASEIPVAEVLEIATREAGAQLGVEQLGVLGEGAPADFVLFREDPTLDLGALDTLEAVIADGRLYTRGELDAAIREQLDYFDGPFYSTLYRAASRTLIAAVVAWDRL